MMRSVGPGRRRAICRSAVTILALVWCALAAAKGDRPAEPGDDSSHRTRGETYYHLMRANLLARQGDVAEAARELRAAVRLEPESAALKIEAADLLFSIGQRAEAERWVREALVAGPTDPHGLRLLGEILLSRSMAAGGDPRTLREAAEVYSQLVDLPDAIDEDFRILATIRLQLGEGDGGVSAARALVQRAPANQEATRLLVRALEQAGQGREAAAALLDWLEASAGSPVGPTDVLRVTGLAAQLIAREDAWDLVAARGERLVRAHPDSAVLYSLYGEALLRTGREAEAAGQLETAVRLTPEGAGELEFYLATAYASIGRLYDAAEIAERMAAEDPESVAIRNLQGEVLAQRGDIDRAVSTFDETIRLLGTDPERREARDGLRRRIASLELARGRTDAVAVRLAEMEVPGRPDDLELAFLAAIRDGDVDRARAALRSLSEASNGAPFASLLEGELLAREGNTAGAQSRFRSAAEALGVGVLARGAEALRASGHAAAGQELLREWVAREPASATAHFRLGAFLEREKRYAEADVELARAVKLAPDHAEALNYLGYSLADRGVELERAIELVRRAVQLDPWNPAYQDSLGWALYRMGRFEEAREPLTQASRDLPFDPVILDHLGDLYDRLGERELALDLWRRALDHNPHDPAPIRRKLGTTAGEGTPLR